MPPFYVLNYNLYNLSFILELNVHCTSFKYACRHCVLDIYDYIYTACVSLNSQQCFTRYKYRGDKNTLFYFDITYILIHKHVETINNLL